MTAYVEEIDSSGMQADDAADLLASLRARALSGIATPSTLEQGTTPGSGKPSFMANEQDKLESFDGARDRYGLKFHAGQQMSPAA